MGFIQTNSYLINVSHITTVRGGINGAIISLSDGRKLQVTCGYNEILIAISEAREGIISNVEYFDE